MRTLADNGAYVLAEQGERLLFFRRRGLVPGWAVFVAGLCTLILAINGVVQLLVPGGLAGAGLGLLAGSVVVGALAVSLVRRRRAGLARPLEPREAIVVVDVAGRLLTDAAGGRLAPLEVVRFERAFQPTSSARMLRVVWPEGARVVYRGDPFTGTIDEPIAQLSARGLRCA